MTSPDEKVAYEAARRHIEMEFFFALDKLKKEHFERLQQVQEAIGADRRKLLARLDEQRQQQLQALEKEGEATFRLVNDEFENKVKEATKENFNRAQMLVQRGHALELGTSQRQWDPLHLLPSVPSAAIVALAGHSGPQDAGAVDGVVGLAREGHQLVHSRTGTAAENMMLWLQVSSKVPVGSIGAATLECTRCWTWCMQ